MSRTPEAPGLTEGDMEAFGLRWRLRIQAEAEKGEAEICFGSSSPGQTLDRLTETQFGWGVEGRMRFSVRPDSEPRSADPRATRPAGWRGVARAHLPS